MSVHELNSCMMALVGNLGDMLGCVAMMPITLAENQPTSPRFQCCDWIHGWIMFWMMCHRMTPGHIHISLGHYCDVDNDHF